MTHSHAQSESSTSGPQALGAYLIGLIDSFNNTRILDIDKLPYDLTDLHPEQWYPFSYAHALATLIAETLPKGSSLAFWAGVRFIEQWYHQGPGKALIFSSLDWVVANQHGGGYGSVVQGELEQVGWTKGQEVDIEKGYALIESVMPWDAEYLKGVLFGGLQIFDDLSQFDVEVVSVSQEADLPFPKTIFKMSFKPKKATLPQDNPKTSEDYQKQIAELLIIAEQKQKILTMREQYIQETEFLLKSSVAQVKKAKNDLQEINKQLVIEATTDSLTGLNNKRYFYDQIEQLCSIASRRGYPIYAIIIDIDYFKPYNDFYGHLEGDQAIRKVADCLKAVFKRGEDMVCRFGGEEFVCVSLCNKPKEAEFMAEKIAEAIASAKILHARSKVCDVLTVSIGSATAKPSEVNIETLLARADQALYEAKNNGRNRHVAFTKGY